MLTETDLRFYQAVCRSRIVCRKVLTVEYILTKSSPRQLFVQLSEFLI